MKVEACRVSGSMFLNLLGFTPLMVAIAVPPQRLDRQQGSQQDEEGSCD